MPTLTIGNRNVEVDDSFLKMSPDDQNKAVDEIAGHLGLSGQPAPATAPAAPPAARPTGGGYGDRDVNGRTGSTALGVMDTLTFGFGDEIGAGINAGIDAGLNAITGREGKSYQQWHDKLQGLQENAREQHPGYYLGGQVAGAIASPTTRARSLVPVLAEGAASGAAYGAGSADGGLADRLEGAAWGGVTGAGGAMLGHTVGNAVTKRLARDAIPTTQELQAAGDALYNAADAANVVLRPQVVQKMVGNAKFAAGRLDTDVRPFTAGTIGDFEAKLGQPMGLREFDDLRKSLNNALSSASAKEDIAQLTTIKRQMDHLADNLTAGDLASGQLEGVEHLKEARRLWSMKSKVESVEKIMRDAEIKTAGTGNFENRVRDQFKSIAVDDDRMGQFSQVERDAILKVAKGGPVVNTLRTLGKFAPDSLLLPLIGYSGAAAASGFVPALAVPAGGLAAKAGATAITRGNVRALDEVIRSGGLTVGDIIEQGRRGVGPGVAAVERGGAVSDRLRVPLARNAALADEYRRR